MKNIVMYWRALPGWSTHFTAKVAWLFLLVIGTLAIFGPLIANEKPYYCQLDGISYFPLFTNVSEAGLSARHPSFAPVDWNKTAFPKVWRAPVPYSHSTIDLDAGAFRKPFTRSAKGSRFNHWLGTDGLGRDVLSGMIRGCRVSLLIGLGAMIIALIIGVAFGAAGAYWGNKEWRLTWGQLALLGVGAVFIFFLWFIPLSAVIKTLVTLLIASGLFLGLKRTKGKSRGHIPIPLDQMVMSVISIIDGFPAIFLIVILVAIVPLKGWIVVMLTIALLRWPSMARYMRAEVFKMKESNYIKAAQILNLSPVHILRKHIIPFAFRPVMVSFIFGISSAILAESSLSFLGIGLPTEEINWGRLLAQSRNHFDAWWLVVFPGCAIFFTLLSLYTIGNLWEKEGREGLIME
jgi:peptide/nickel transport system permease protein